MNKIQTKKIDKLTMKLYLKLVDSGVDVSKEQVKEYILKLAKKNT